MKIDGIENEFCEMIAGPVEDLLSDPPCLDRLAGVSDAQVIADYFAEDPANKGYWDAATADERAAFLEERKQQPRYTMTPDEYAKYVRGQQEMNAYVNTAGMSPEARAAHMEEFYKRRTGGVPVWIWLAGAGAAAFFIFRKKAA